MSLLRAKRRVGESSDRGRIPKLEYSVDPSRSNLVENEMNQHRVWQERVVSRCTIQEQWRYVRSLLDTICIRMRGWSCLYKLCDDKGDIGSETLELKR